MGEHMFKDLTLSRDLMLQYRGHTADAAKMKNETVMVLQRSFWPFSARKEDIKLPDEVRIPADRRTCALTLVRSCKRSWNSSWASTRRSSRAGSLSLT
jgi:hypothetical protein